jgi:thioredoxin-like negative regulator of GroEL
MPETTIAPLDTESFAAFVVNEPAAAVVDFRASWCGPWLALALPFEPLAGRLAGQPQRRKLNVNDAFEQAAAFGVRSILTLILFTRGRLQSRRVGLHDEQQLATWAHAVL